MMPYPAHRRVRFTPLPGRFAGVLRKREPLARLSWQGRLLQFDT